MRTRINSGSVEVSAEALQHVRESLGTALPEGMPFNSSFDARVWADAFVSFVEKNPRIATDRETMLGWFANALMRGYDEGRAARGRDESSANRE